MGRPQSLEQPCPRAWGFHHTSSNGKSKRHQNKGFMAGIPPLRRRLIIGRRCVGCSFCLAFWWTWALGLALAVLAFLALSFGLAFPQTGKRILQLCCCLGTIMDNQQLSNYSAVINYLSVSIRRLAQHCLHTGPVLHFNRRIWHFRPRKQKKQG